MSVPIIDGGTTAGARTKGSVPTTEWQRLTAILRPEVDATNATVNVYHAYSDGKCYLIDDARLYEAP